MIEAARRPSRPYSIAGIVLLAWLSGCAQDRLLSGERIVADLHRDGIRSPEAAAGPASRPVDDVGLPATGPITLVDLFRTAEAHNPDLAAARSAVGVAAGALWQASLYPNPRLDAEVEDATWREGFAGSKTTVGITQPIVLGRRIAAAIDEAGAERAARFAEYRAAHRLLMGEVAVEHARLIALREQSRLLRTLRESAARTLTAARARFEARAAPETDVIRPRVEVHRIDAALGRLEQESRASAKRLGLLLGGATVDVDRLEGEAPLIAEPLPAARLEAAVRRRHPSLAAADGEIAAASARLERERAERTPDLDLRLAGGYSGDQDSGVVEFGAGMTLPLWDVRQGLVFSARFALAQARQRRAAMENDLLARLAEATGEYEAARVQLDAFRERIVPDAQRAFDQTDEAYRAGRSGFLDLLDAQRTLIEARLTLVELAGAAAAAKARVFQIVGDEESVARATEHPSPERQEEVQP